VGSASKETKCWRLIYYHDLGGLDPIFFLLFVDVAIESEKLCFKLTDMDSMMERKKNVSF
jgi:hypothetical protein